MKVSNDRGLTRSYRRRSEAASIGSLVCKYQLSRRSFISGLTTGSSVLAMNGCALTTMNFSSSSSLTFEEIELLKTPHEVLAKNYTSQVIIKWGDALFKDAPAFDPQSLTPEIAERQFGVNNDFIAFLPYKENDNAGILFANHEYPNPHLMWPNISETSFIQDMSSNQIKVTMASVGASIVELNRIDGDWKALSDSPLNRRITANTPMLMSGPAAGHSKLKTSYDPTGTKAFGTLSNCNGGVTPWGTILTCEEGAGWIFEGDYASTPDPDLLKRYYYDEEENNRWNWASIDPRFSLQVEPNEPNKFEWVVEIDPNDPMSTPVKRTALGRFAHEGAQTVLAPDGRVVVYLGDDWEFEYCYRFVSANPVKEGGAKANINTLDEGILSVARFYDTGKVQWLPLVFGEGPLTPENGFHSQADVLINTRGAADLLKATPMDSPEGFAPNPHTGTVVIALSSNADRIHTDPANPRPNNRFGHMLELHPPRIASGIDHAADEFEWTVLALCGNPSDPAHHAHFHPETSKRGWFTDPDNIGFDPLGRLWVCTDGVQPSGHDALYAMDLTGKGRALPKLFYAPPDGAECCSPTFINEGKTLLIGIQHPGEGVALLKDVPTLWPDFDKNLPPRAAVIAITHVNGAIIGT